MQFFPQNRTLAAGRYSFQSYAESLIPADVIAKLQPAATSRFLDIGCGPGLLLSAIEPLVALSVGIDCETQIDMARDNSSARLIAGDFRQIALNETFDRILIYSVVHTLRDLDAIKSFIDKAADLLAPGGRLLVGDIPNSDTKATYLATPTGKRMREDWATMVLDTPKPAAFGDGIGALSSLDIFGLMYHFRQRGFSTYLLPQPPDLPFGNTREDILIVSP